MSHYLRVSLTDRCNLRCIYCLPQGYRLPGAGAMTHPERVRLTRVLVEGFGFRKVRLTGGEPLTYSRLDELVETVAAWPEIEDLALTTNGIGLRGRAARLKARRRSARR